MIVQHRILPSFRSDVIIYNIISNSTLLVGQLCSYRVGHINIIELNVSYLD